jgi:hypothetical protein
MNAFSTRFGMSGWRPPWSMTSPRTSCVSDATRCCIFMTSIMCRSMGLRYWSAASGRASERVPRRNKGQATFGRSRGADREDGVDDVGGELLRERAVQFCGEGGVRNVDEGSTVEVGRLLESVKELCRG